MGSETYRAMALTDASPRSLVPVELPTRSLRPGEIRIRVRACGVCRTGLHIVDGELETAQRPRVPGHEIVGTVVERGDGASTFAMGTRVGVTWLAGTCHHCPYCARGLENLCEQALFTGWSVDGGYAGYAIAREAYCFALPPAYGDDDAADGAHRAGDLADELRHRVLALPRDRPVRRPRGRIVLGGHALRCALVPQESPGFRDWRVRCRELGRGGQQVCRAG